MPAIPIIFSYELHRVRFQYYPLFSKATSAKENVQVVQQMPAALWQGDLVAALDAVAEDVDFRASVTRGRSAGISSLKPRRGCEEVAT